MPDEKVKSVEDAGSTQVEPPYSIFKRLEKLRIVLLIAFASVFSPLSSWIYFPALTTISNDLHTTLSKINLTITSYMIVSAVAPMLIGSIADQLGRRPVYIITLLTYVVVNIGLASQTSYPALLLLRMLQSAGGSATIGLGYGVIGDIAESSDRGAYMGIFGCGPNITPSLGPVLGGFLVLAGWRWTFGFLAISGALCLLLIAIVLPETGRSIVGNGSRPINPWNKSFLMLWQERTSKYLLNRQQRGVSEGSPRKMKFRLPSPKDSILICLCKDTGPVIFLNAVFYAAMNCLQASLSSLFIDIYGYNALEASLIYLPFGVSCFIATVLSCKLRCSLQVRHV